MKHFVVTIFNNIIVVKSFNLTAAAGVAVMNMVHETRVMCGWTSGVDLRV